MIISFRFDEQVVNDMSIIIDGYYHLTIQS